MNRAEVISRRLPACPDPLHTYAGLTAGGMTLGTALLESADRGQVGTRRSLLVLSSALRIELRGTRIRIEASSANGRSAIHLLGGSGDVLELPAPQVTTAMEDEDRRLLQPSVFDPLRQILDQLRPVRASDHHRLLLVGALSYELAARFEGAIPATDAPDYVALVPELMLDIDHLSDHAEVIAIAFDERSRNDLASRVAALGATAPIYRVDEIDEPECIEVDCDDARFVTRVESAQEEIRAGSVYQLVLSRKWTAPCPHPLAAYARLRRDNPSPYLFYLRDRALTLFGASPESAVRLDATTRTLDIYPVAGTRPRGADPDEDARLEAQLRQDHKELAEHMMLVDLARNDIARVCTPGSRAVPLLLGVDRYAHVMHLVSRVQGTLRDGLDAFHALRACLNMGTLTGAPKLRASALIGEMEDGPRGFYGGAVGIIDGAGNLDTAITIRAATVVDGIASIRAGAGVVLDSNPQAEAAETRSKATAVLRAVAGVAA